MSSATSSSYSLGHLWDDPYVIYFRLSRSTIFAIVFNFFHIFGWHCLYATCSIKFMVSFAVSSEVLHSQRVSAKGNEFFHIRLSAVYIVILSQPLCIALSRTASTSPIFKVQGGSYLLPSVNGSVGSLTTDSHCDGVSTE